MGFSCAAPRPDRENSLNYSNSLDYRERLDVSFWPVATDIAAQANVGFRGVKLP
jgi:hypothetical protein